MIDVNKIKLAKLPRPEKTTFSGLIHNKQITVEDYEKLRSNILTALSEGVKPAQISEWLEFTKYPLSEQSIRTLRHLNGTWLGKPPRYHHIDGVWDGNQHHASRFPFTGNDAIKEWGKN